MLNLHVGASSGLRAKTFGVPDSRASEAGSKVLPAAPGGQRMIRMAGMICASAMSIRSASPEDAAAIAEILMPVIREGTTYSLDRSMSETDALAYWLSADKETFVAAMDDRIIGTYYLRANQPGGGRSVCNCGYMTRQDVTGRGVARMMCLHSLSHARLRAYRAMQLNYVVSSNERAIRLWQSVGFEVVGRLPGAFEHPALGFVDVLVMYLML